jgi:hypothetical protein
VNKALPHSKTVKWLYIHSISIQAIVSDMCSKQAVVSVFYIVIDYNVFLTQLGLRDCLNSVDLLRRPWHWHIERSIIYCSIHFKRGIDSSDFKETSYAEMMKDILTLDTVEVSICLS